MITLEIDTGITIDDGIPIPRAKAVFKNLSYEQSDRVINTLFFTIYVSNDPILLDVHHKAIANKTKTLNDIVNSQRVIYQGDYYIDDASLYVYVYCEPSQELSHKIIDLRYDLCNRECPSEQQVSANELGNVLWVGREAIGNPVRHRD